MKQSRCPYQAKKIVFKCSLGKGFIRTKDIKANLLKQDRVSTGKGYLSDLLPCKLVQTWKLQWDIWMAEQGSQIFFSIIILLSTHRLIWNMIKLHSGICTALPPQGCRSFAPGYFGIPLINYPILNSCMYVCVVRNMA